MVKAPSSRLPLEVTTGKVVQQAPPAPMPKLTVPLALSPWKNQPVLSTKPCDFSTTVNCACGWPGLPCIQNSAVKPPGLTSNSGL